MEVCQIKMLVDTNVWLDNYIPDRPLAEDSRRLLTYGVQQDVAVLYPLRALNDVFWHVTRDRKRWAIKEYGKLSEAFARAINSEAWDCVKSMTETGCPVGADVSDVFVAQHLQDIHNDFEDDMVLAAAKRASVDYLVTSDRRLIQKSIVPALTPQDMLAVLRLRKEQHIL